MYRTHRRRLRTALNTPRQRRTGARRRVLSARPADPLSTLPALVACTAMWNVEFAHVDRHTPTEIACPSGGSEGLIVPSRMQAACPPARIHTLLRFEWFAALGDVLFACSVDDAVKRVLAEAPSALDAQRSLRSSIDCCRIGPASASQSRVRRLVAFIARKLSSSAPSDVRVGQLRLWCAGVTLVDFAGCYSAVVRAASGQCAKYSAEAVVGRCIARARARGAAPSDDVCCVCLEAFAGTACCLHCSHWLHADCLHMLLQRAPRRKCPLCRADVRWPQTPRPG